MDVLFSNLDVLFSNDAVEPPNRLSRSARLIRRGDNPKVFTSAPSNMAASIFLVCVSHSLVRVGHLIALAKVSGIQKACYEKPLC